MLCWRAFFWQRGCISCMSFLCPRRAVDASMWHCYHWAENRSHAMQRKMNMTEKLWWRNCFWEIHRVAKPNSLPLQPEFQIITPFFFFYYKCVPCNILLKLKSNQTSRILLAKSDRRGHSLIFIKKRWLGTSLPFPSCCHVFSYTEGSIEGEGAQERDMEVRRQPHWRSGTFWMIWN